MQNIIRAFLSHSSSDKEAVYRVKKELDKHGILTWIDELQIGVGESIRQEIDRAIASSNFLILFLSKKSVESEWVQREIDAAFIKEIESKDTTIIPVLLETCDIPITLKAKRYIDMRRDGEKGTAGLIDALVYPKQSVLRALTGRWISTTGVLFLSSVGNLIIGKYDWQDEKSGNIFGHVEKNCVKFNWSWDYSLEHGIGIFILDDAHRRLEGGWWFIDANIDPDANLEILKLHEGFHSWSFDIDETTKRTIDAKAAIENIRYGVDTIRTYAELSRLTSSVVKSYANDLTPMRSKNHEEIYPLGKQITKKNPKRIKKHKK